MNRRSLFQKITLAAMLLGLNFLINLDVHAAQFVGQVISQYQSMEGNYYRFVLDTGSQLLPLEVKYAADERAFKKILKRSSGKVIKVSGTRYSLGKEAEDGNIKNYFRISYLDKASSTRKLKGVISKRSNSRSHLDRYEIKEIDVNFPSTYSIVLNGFEDQLFEDEYRDQEVEIEYSEFYISWRKIRFVSNINLL